MNDSQFPLVPIRSPSFLLGFSELKRSLYALFSQFGAILEIVALKSSKLRGQAFVVFKDIAAATNAMRQLQGFPFYDKPIRIRYAKEKSDVVAKLDGSFKDNDKKRAEKRKAEGKKALLVLSLFLRLISFPHSSYPFFITQTQPLPPPLAALGPKKPKREKTEPKPTGEALPGAAGGAAVPVRPQIQPPNNILFVENLPEQANELMLSMLFQQYVSSSSSSPSSSSSSSSVLTFSPLSLHTHTRSSSRSFCCRFPGFQEVRLVSNKKGIAFVEFSNEIESGVAMTGLQGFKVTPEKLMVISYAKK
jgi:RNA recognition motif-containing protein